MRAQGVRRHLFSFRGALRGGGPCAGRTGSHKSAAGVRKSASAIAALHTGASQAIWAAGGGKMTVLFSSYCLGSAKTGGIIDQHTTSCHGLFCPQVWQHL